MYPLATAMRLAAEAGYEAIELVMCPEVWLRGTTPVRRAAERYGLAIPTVHQTLFSFSTSGGGPARVIEATRAAVALGVPTVVFHAPAAKRWDEPAAQRWLRALEAAQRLAEGTGTRLALENPGAYGRREEQGVVSRPADLVACARRYDLDLTLDTCHAGTAGFDLLETYDAMRERLVNIHLSDLRPLHLPWHPPLVDIVWSHHQLPGDGCLDLAPLVARLQADGYQGSVTAEISFMALAFWSPREAVRRLHRLVAFVRAHSAGATSDLV
jgi:sugar phosphate isomerase/epimerase